MADLYFTLKIGGGIVFIILVAVTLIALAVHRFKK